MRQPFGPLIVRSRRGMLHRAQQGPRIHPRCSGGKPFRGDVLTPDETLAWAQGRDAVLCRYPWCFRDLVEKLGIDPEVGHFARYIRHSRKWAA